MTDRTLSLLGIGHERLAPSTDLADALRFVERSDIDATAEEFRAGIVEFVRAHADALERTNAIGHLTGSAVVFDAAGERVVLLHHRKLQRWLQPGGHADGDANLAAVALREATEETAMHGLVIDPTAVDLDIHQVDHGPEGLHAHLDVRFLVMAPPGAEVIGNHESTAIAWVPFADLDHYDLDVGTHRMVDHARRRLRRH